MYLAQLPLGLSTTGREGLFLGGAALLLIGFFFKVSAVPFHMWTPDVYQGAPTTLTGFMSTASKTAAFASLLGVLYVGMQAQVEHWGLVLSVVAAVTMVAGNLLALGQKNVKRMLAYSSVAHAGYILTGLAAGTPEGYSGALYYLLVYTLMNIGAFGVMAALEWDGEQGREQTIDSLAGVGQRKPLLGIAMSVFMLALTGFPPLAGFIGKFQVFEAAIEADLLWLALVGLVASVVSAFYYLRVPATMWMRSDDNEEAQRAKAVSLSLSPAATTVLVVCAVLLVVLFVVPGTVLGFTQSFFNLPTAAAGF